jgi:Ser/Thr protein kinase RdoA (MazF antagonist)
MAESKGPSGKGKSVRQRQRQETVRGHDGAGGQRYSETTRRQALALAETALGRWGVSDARLSPLSLGYKHVFRVSGPGGKEFVLRTYGRPDVDEDTLRRSPELRTGVGLRSPETLRSQLAWLAALATDEGLRVPQPVPASDGSVVVLVGAEGRWSRLLPAAARRSAREGERSGRRCVLLGWVPGEQRAENLSPREASLAGSLLARMHRHGEQFDLREAPALPRWNWDWSFGLRTPIWREGVAFYSSDAMRTFERADAGCRALLKEIGHGRSVFGPTHHDLRLMNLVFEEGKVGAIDFDGCGLGHYLFDFAKMSSSLRAHLGDRTEPIWEAFLAGYEAERPLPESLDRHLWAFVAMRRMATVNRRLVLAYPAGGPACRAEHKRFLTDAAGWFEHLDLG